MISSARLLLYPALRALPATEHAAALARARAAKLDTIEWIGVIGSLALVSGLLGLDRSWLAPLPPPMRFVVLMPFAAGLLAITAGPFLLRRTRRALQREIERLRLAQH